jgi:hypothetical protein
LVYICAWKNRKTIICNSQSIIFTAADQMKSSLPVLWEAGISQEIFLESYGETWANISLKSMSWPLSKASFWTPMWLTLMATHCHLSEKTSRLGIWRGPLRCAPRIMTWDLVQTQLHLLELLFTGTLRSNPQCSAKCLCLDCADLLGLHPIHCGHGCPLAPWINKTGWCFEGFFLFLF